MKTCKSCEAEKTLDCFSIKKTKSGGYSYQSSCKPCRAKMARDFRKEKPEIARAIAQKSRSNKTDEQKVRQAAYLVEWRKANKEKIKSYRTKDLISKYSKTFYENHKQKIKSSVSEYRKNNLKKIRALNQTRRSKIRAGKLSSNIVDVLFEKQKGVCVCCLAKLGNDFHLDHIIPLSLGGTNTDDNVQLLKSKCNLQKNAKHPVDFMRERGYLL